MYTSPLCPTGGNGRHSRDPTQSDARPLQCCKEKKQQFKEEPGCTVEHEGAQQVTRQPDWCSIFFRGGGPQYTAGEGVQCPKSYFSSQWGLFLWSSWELCHWLWKCPLLLLRAYTEQNKTILYLGHKLVVKRSVGLTEAPVSQEGKPLWLTAGSTKVAVKLCLNWEARLVSCTPAWLRSCVNDLFWWKPIGWQTRFLRLEKRNKMISVPVIMTAMNLLSTDAHPRSPLLWALPSSLQTVSVTYSIQKLPLQLMLICSFHLVFCEEMGRMSFVCLVSLSVPKIKEKSSVHRATGHGGKRFPHWCFRTVCWAAGFHVFGLDKVCICNWFHRTKYYRSPLIINFSRKSSEWKLLQTNKIHPKTCCSQVRLPVKRWHWLKLNRKDTDLCNKAFLLYFVHYSTLFAYIFEIFLSVQVLMLLILFLFINRFDSCISNQSNFLGEDLNL